MKWILGITLGISIMILSVLLGQVLKMRATLLSAMQFLTDIFYLNAKHQEKMEELIYQAGLKKPKLKQETLGKQERSDKTEFYPPLSSKQEANPSRTRT